MISSQVIQKTLDELRMITRIDLCVMDIDGKVNSTTFATEEEDFGDVRAFAESMADSQVMKGCHFFKIYDNQTVEYILVAKGGNEDAYMIGRVAVAEIQNLIVAYKERFDKSNFIQNLILDNLLLVDVYNRAKKLHIPVESKRVVLLVETRNEKDQDSMEILKNLFIARNNDFITAIDEKNIIIVRTLEESDGYEEIESTYERKEPFVTNVGGVIKGWTEALKMMPVGSKWELYIPQELAYGSRDMGQIKPFSTLIFEIELLDIEK